ncbi:MAG: hypothetical protein JJE04_15085 [Acidobacteriia bacterium]|nr:hypothetical protein [Terriglobia bacterium]
MKLISLSILLATAAAGQDVASWLAKPLLDPRQSLVEAQVYTGSRVPPLPVFRSQAEWEKYSAPLRSRILNEVVFRGEAVKWRAAKTKVEFLEEEAGAGYRLRKLRYEAIPGLWVPALIYEPEKLTGKVPVVLNVNGHEKTGISTPYIQERCINLARKGIIAVNLEWLGRGQLDTPGFSHYRMQQMDLAGASGLAVFFLAMQRGLDIAAGHASADKTSIAVTGLSGGGWQTILLSALDTRVALANPVAGYSSFVTRSQWPDLDLGDSEQTPSDLASIADYTHLSAMMAPRVLQLGFNAKDTCCFRADYAIAPLMQASEHVYRLYHSQDKLRYSINHGEGHNYDRENRQAFYRLLRDHFYLGQLDAVEQSAAADVRTAEQLKIDLPAENLDFHKIALSLSKTQPSDPKPTAAKLAYRARTKRYQVESFPAGEEAANGISVRYWKLEMDRAWTVPVVEMSPQEPKSTVLLLADNGRKSAASQAQGLLNAGQRVVAVDPFYLGESAMGRRDFLFAFLIASLGERPLGVQASQLMAIARWLDGERKMGPVSIHAVGPRTSLAALVAAALEEKAISSVTLEESFQSLKEILERDLTADKTPELFCFGLLEVFDIPQLKALVAPRKVFTSAAP